MRFSRDRSPRCPRARGRPAPCLAALRRTHGRRRGSTRPATPTRTATSPTAQTTRGPTATGSSGRSTTTCRTTSSSPGSSPATCCRTPRATRSRHRVQPLHRMTNEGGSIAEEWLVENAADRVHTFGTAMLGLTLECARCHDHKYDPISPRDYYSLSAFFNSIDENGMYDQNLRSAVAVAAAADAEQEAEDRRAQARRSRTQETCLCATCRRTRDARVSAVARDRVPTRPAAPVDLAGSFPLDDGAGADNCSIAAPPAKNSRRERGAGHAASAGRRAGKAFASTATDGVEFPELLEVDRWDRSRSTSGCATTAATRCRSSFSSDATARDVGYNGFDLMLADGVLTRGSIRVWPGNAHRRAGHGADRRRRVAARRRHLRRLEPRRRAATVSRRRRAWPTTVLRDASQSASTPLAAQRRLTLRRAVPRPRLQGRRARRAARLQPGRYRRSKSASFTTAGARAADQAPRADRRRTGVAARLLLLRRRRRGARSRRSAPRRAAASRRGRRDNVSEVSVMEELPEPRPTYILPRGAYDAPKTTPTASSATRSSSLCRRFPRTRRAIASAWPSGSPIRTIRSPPACSSIGCGPTSSAAAWWRRPRTSAGKERRPRIPSCSTGSPATSSTTAGTSSGSAARSSSRPRTGRTRARSAELRERDPETSLLARGPSRRLSAEQDSRLGARRSAGLLEPADRRPAGVALPAGRRPVAGSNSMFAAVSAVDAAKACTAARSTPLWKRTAPLPNMMAFDAPTREVCTVRRGRTNTPLQALVLLNDVSSSKPPAALARGCCAKADHDRTTGCDDAFLRLTGRRAGRRRAAIARGVYNEQRALFADDAGRTPAKFLDVGESKLDCDTLPPSTSPR